jgi:hypothetical protein
MGGTDLFKGAFGQVSSLANPVDLHFGVFDRGNAFSHGLCLFGRVAVTAEIDDGDGTHDTISYPNEAYCFGLGVDHGCLIVAKGTCKARPL